MQEFIVGHESAHRKLFPQTPIEQHHWAVIFVGPLDLSIFQKILDFHHAANRRDPKPVRLMYTGTSQPNHLQRLWPHVLWFFGILCGGWFIHSLISILLFLMLPVSIAGKFHLPLKVDSTQPNTSWSLLLSTNRYSLCCDSADGF